MLFLPRRITVQYAVSLLKSGLVLGEPCNIVGARMGIAGNALKTTT